MRLLEFALLVLCVIGSGPFLALVAGNTLRARFGRVRMALAVLWVGWVSSLALLYVLVPGLLWFPAVAVLSLAWRGRETYGQSRGLPKGSLTLTHSLEAIADRAFYNKQAQDFGPVFKMSQFHQATICVVGLEKGHRLFREHKESFGPCAQPFTRVVAGGFLRYMDDSTHKIYTNLFRQVFTHPVLADVAPEIRVLCRTAMNDLVNACGTQGISPRAFCEQFIFDTFVRILFGLKPGTKAYEEMKEAYTGLAGYNIGKKVDARTQESLDCLRQFLRDHKPAISCTLSELKHLDSSMPDAVCIDNLLFIVKISTANVASLLLWLFKRLGEHPEWMQRISGAPDVAGKEGRTAVIDRVVKETLRLGQSEYLYRRLLEDVEVDGLTLPKGWIVRLCVAESHRLESSFERPAEFNPDRFLRDTIGVKEFAPFGVGTHACIGVPLTEIICRALLHELAIGFDWSVSRDGPLERGFRHWNHWQPSSNLRVRMAARSQVG